jgi:UDPglucose 6-dehydrogenase
VAQALTGPAIIVTKSTVPVGTGARIEALFRANTRHHCPVVSNPEFLKEGSAVADFIRPDRVVIGADDPAAGDELAELHAPFVRNNKPILRMSRAAAELAKYAANAYLATRISFINEIAEICERLNVDVNEVRLGMGSDARIGHHFLYPGLGYGGSCFPKDVQALSNFGGRRARTASCSTPCTAATWRSARTCCGGSGSASARTCVGASSRSGAWPSSPRPTTCARRRR